MSVDGVPPFLSQVPADRHMRLWSTGGSLMAIFLSIVGSLGTLSHPNTAESNTVVASMIDPPRLRLRSLLEPRSRTSIQLKRPMEALGKQLFN